LIYLDNNATTALADEAREAMLSAMQDGWGNPSAIHAPGRQARRIVERAREQVAQLINAEPSEIYFVSGGSEANVFALVGGYLAHRSERPEVAVGTTEHPSVVNTARYLESTFNAVTREIGVDGDGLIQQDQLAQLVTDRTALVSVMLANNVTGTVADISSIARVTNAQGALLHTDAIQGLGKIAIDLRALGVDLVSLSAHKLHGPKGIGALVVKRNVVIDPIVHGGGQERGLRSGTENVIGIAGFGAAAVVARRQLDQTAARMTALRDRFEARAAAAISGVRVVAAAVSRLPNTSCLTIDQVDGEALLVALDHAGVAASSGSACHTGSSEPSPALLAMGLHPLAAQGTLRFSLSQLTTEPEVDQAVTILSQVVERVRAEVPVPSADAVPSRQGGR
jgi:cysteine desulfurase